MQLYSCKVRHGGSLYNEIPKIGATAPEIAVLRVIHGQDSVVDIRPQNDIRPDWDEKRERERLEHIYGGALRKIEDVKNLNGIFGVAGPLPKHVEGVGDEVFPAEKPKRVKRGRPSAADKAEAEIAAEAEQESEQDDAMAELG